ncbi:MAG TPA: AMP-binding protein, partial [Thermoanaerobaculia bacterium]|nr:AMP-binding protein [Thermoanaerobaculia bacterium]
PGATADNLAYVIHTSGSTGRPKGVAVTHRAAVRLVRGSGCARFAPDEVFLALAPVSFDASTFEIWGPLANGGRLALMPPETPALAELAAAIARHGVTTLWLTAGLFHQMVDEQLDGLRPVRQLLAGGDALSPAHARRLLAALPATRLVNGYGPTENTTFTCCGPLPAGAGGAALPLGGGVPIGRPIGNTDAFVLCGGSAAAPPAALAPIGVAGELVTGGDGLARGYYRRPDSTAESFRPHPFAAVPGARVYHTGDRVRFLADGRLDFLGRCDRQVKVRGFRVEPGEVEAALTGHPAVAAAVVTAVAEPGAAGGKRLAAYLVAHGGPGAAPLPPPQALRAWLRGRLPEVLVPQAFVALAALPLTPNGKIDRAALPDPDFGAGAAGGGGGQPVRAPRTPEEDLLAAIWTEVLGREGIGIDDDFFALGGHSLLATRVASRLRVAFGVELPLRRLFAAPTIAALARAVAAARRERGGQDTAPPRPRPRGAEPPLSFAQERLWFLDQLQPGNPAYNLALAVSLHGDLAPAALGAAIATVTRRHEVLRTRFPARHGRPWQEIALPPPRPAGTAPAMVTLPQVDLRRLPLPGRQPELDRQLADLASRPFDLAHGPLVRWALLRLANDGEDHPAALAALGGRQGAGATATGASPDRPPGAASVFACVQHHIITDGWSLGLLWRDLAALYAAFSGAGPDSGPGSGEAPARTPGRADDAAPQPLPYADYAVWQREMLASGAFAPQLAYWRERLAGELPVLALPVDRQRRAGPAGGGVVAAALPPELSARVAACGRRAGATPFMTLLAAWTVLLHRLGGQDDVLVGVPIAGRNRVEIEGTLGFFVNTLVLRTDLAGNPPFRALLAQVREGALGAYAHQDLPFERLVAELQPERNLARAPLVQVFFNHLNFENFSAAALPGLTTLVMPIAAPPAKFELSVYAAERQGSFLLRLHYDSAIFDQARIAEMARQLERLLAAFCGEENGPLDDAHPAHSAHPAHPEEAAEPGIDDVSLLTPSAAAVLPDPRRALAAAASGGAGGRSVGELVSRQAHRAGWRLAVADEAERFTYGALETAANRLARFLETAGLAPGEVVAIAAERRAALAWAVVGAVKARAAFLLLDPAHPAARRAAMLRLAGARAYVCLPGADTAAAEPEIAAAVAGLRLRCTVSPRQAAELTARGAADPGAPAPPGPDDLAYVVFTSGSTGEPKAVAGTHAPLCHFIAWYAAAC